MKPTLVSMEQWPSTNGRTRTLPGDQWYINLATKVFPIVKRSLLFKENDYMQKSVTILLCMYFRDAIVRAGGWKIFSESYYSLYNAYLPFYQLSDGYIPSEINKENIAFALWALKSHAALYEPDEYTLQDSYDKDLLALAREVYTLMDGDFEKAPINEEPSSMLWVMGLGLLEVPLTPLPKIIPETGPNKNAEHCLKYSGSKLLLYFTTYKELCKFFIDILKWESSLSSLLPGLQDKEEFVVYTNAKGILIVHNVVTCFCEEHSPMYNSECAATEGYKLFCYLGACPFDLIKYGIAERILPDV